MSKTDLVLINPANRKQAYGDLGKSLAGIEPPLLIGLLAGYLREEGFSVAIIDAEAESLDANGIITRIEGMAPRVVGIGVIGANPSASSTPKMTAARPVLRLINKRRLPCKTFLYGIHPSALPERTLREEQCDFVIRGEAFNPVARLLREIRSERYHYHIQGVGYLKDSRFVDNGWADIVRDLDSLPPAAWDLLPMDKYRAHNWQCLDDIDHRSPYAVIYTGLGCPFHCYYCNVHALYDGKPGLRRRSPGRVLEDIDRLYQQYHIRRIKILDELFVFNKDRLFEICDRLIERDYGLDLWAYARIDTVSRDILKKLKQAGVNWLAFGIEAGADRVRQGVSKGRFDQASVRRAVAMTHEAGIYVLGNFMFGLPDDDMQTMRETLALAQTLACEYVNFYTTMAYPGSPLYAEALKPGGAALPSSWEGYSQLGPEAMPLPTKHLTAAQILRFRDEAFETYYRDVRYLDMIGERFGPKAVAHIQQMLTHKLRRNILSEDAGGLVTSARKCF